MKRKMSVIFEPSQQPNTTQLLTHFPPTLGNGIRIGGVKVRSLIGQDKNNVINRNNIKIIMTIILKIIVIIIKYKHNQMSDVQCNCPTPADQHSACFRPAIPKQRKSRNRNPTSTQLLSPHWSTNRAWHCRTWNIPLASIESLLWLCSFPASCAPER